MTADVVEALASSLCRVSRDGARSAPRASKRAALDVMATRTHACLMQVVHIHVLNREVVVKRADRGAVERDAGEWCSQHVVDSVPERVYICDEFSIRHTDAEIHYFWQ